MNIYDLINLLSTEILYNFFLSDCVLIKKIKIDQIRLYKT